MRSRLKLHFVTGRSGFARVTTVFIIVRHGSKVKVIDYCDANYQKRQEDFYIFHLNTLQPNRLNIKRAQK